VLIVYTVNYLRFVIISAGAHIVHSLLLTIVAGLLLIYLEYRRIKPKLVVKMFGT
jgi:hypothetical protein